MKILECNCLPGFYFVGLVAAILGRIGLVILGQMHMMGEISPQELDKVAFFACGLPFLVPATLVLFGFSAQNRGSLLITFPLAIVAVVLTCWNFEYYMSLPNHLVR